MGTRNNPGKFDCYSKAEPDEPVFVLLGRDPAAPILINLWADIRARMGEEQEKVEEAQACAEACYDWLVKHGKQEAYEKALDAAIESLNESELGIVKAITTPGPLPSVDRYMSDADLTAAAELLRKNADWSRLPKLAAIFEHRPVVNRYWHELVALTLTSLEVNGGKYRTGSEGK